MDRSHSWRAMIQAIGKAGASYVAPGPVKLSTNLLSEVKTSLKTDLERITKSTLDAWLTLTSDGWSNVQNRPILNFVVVGPKGAHYRGSIDTSGHIKTADYIADVMICSKRSVRSMWL